MHRKTTMALALFGVLAIYGFWRFVIDAGNTGPPTLSEETTFVTDIKFVNEQGYVDYHAALNSWRSEGIGRDENACVDLFRFFGPRDYDPGHWEACWKLISDAPLPTGPFFELVLSSGRPALMPENHEAQVRPWRDEEFPELLQWINENSEVMPHLFNATGKKRFYYPEYLEGRDGLLLGRKLTNNQHVREVARFLSIRAMNHLANDRIDECMTDLIAIRSLSRLIEQKGYLIEHLVGRAVSDIATWNERILLSTGKLDSLQIRDYIQRLDQLIPFNNLAVSVNRAERCSALSSIQYVRNNGFGDLVGSNDGAFNTSTSFDIDVAMRQVNERFDVVVDITQAEINNEQDASIAHPYDELNDWERELTGFAIMARAFLGGAKTRGKFVGQAVADMSLPGIAIVSRSNRRVLATARMSRLAFVLEAYRLNNDELPNSLEQLEIADDQQDLMIDPFTQQLFKFERKETGFRLYSLGENGIDDKGLSSFDDGVSETADDVPFEVGNFE